jgi:adenylyltransferase/sulfurtransferase
MNDEQLLRYSRHIMLPEMDVAGQERLLASRALLIGLGGLGSPVSMYLAAAGVGHLVLVDYDSVELSNLQRQIVHATPDLARPKVESARDRLLALNPEITITPVPTTLDEAGLAEQARAADIVIDATDNFASRFAINAACVRAGTPLVSGAAIRFEGQVTVFGNGPESACYRCLYSDEAGEAETCTQNGVMAPLLGIIGSVQAMEAVKILAGLPAGLDGWLLLLDGMRMEWSRVQLRRDPHCPVCALR